MALNGTARDLEEIKHLYIERQFSMKEVAVRLGVAPNTIKRDLIAAGVPRRTLWEQRKIDEAMGRTETQSDQMKRVYAEGRLNHLRPDDKHKARLSELAKQRTGEKNPFFGKRHSQRTKRLLSDHAKARGFGVNNRCVWESLPEETKERIRILASGRCGAKNPFFGKRHTRETRLKISAHHGGDGKSFVPKWNYTAEWTEELRETIRSRDGYLCLICGVEQDKRKHSVHHVDYDRTNNAPENLATTCVKCHCKTNTHRSEWRTFFANLLIDVSGGVL